MKSVQDMRTSVPLHEHTSLRLGGPSRYFVALRDAARAVELQRWAKEEGVAWACLGRGTNVLFRDSGYRGLILQTTSLRGVSIEGTRVLAAAGEPLARIARIACEAGLSGLEWACGIPGTVGGAVVMNAGTGEGVTAETLTHVTYADANRSIRTEAAEVGLEYRRSAFLEGEMRGIIVEAAFELVASTPERTLAAAERLLEERSKQLPEGASAGCTFRNPREGPTAGELLDRAGCKGLRSGDAHVSSRHANFIINDGSQNAADVLELVETMKRRVKDAFGVDLVEEIVVFP